VVEVARLSREAEAWAKSGDGAALIGCRGPGMCRNEEWRTCSWEAFTAVNVTDLHMRVHLLFYCGVAREVGLGKSGEMFIVDPTLLHHGTVFCLTQDRERKAPASGYSILNGSRK
jgi:hypothetical protein